MHVSQFVHNDRIAGSISGSTSKFKPIKLEDFDELTMFTMSLCTTFICDGGLIFENSQKISTHRVAAS